jgi:urea transport system permease protein
VHSLVLHGLDALFYSSTLTLVALGLAVVFGLLGVINIAHGEFVALGAYGLVLGQSAGLGYWGGLLVGVLLAAAAGGITQVVIVRRLQDNLVMTLLAMYGLSLVIREALAWAFGAAGRSAHAPVAGKVSLAGVDYPAYRLLGLLIVFGLVVVLGLLFAKTRVGIISRAVVENRWIAQTVGINVKWVDFTMFALGTGLAGLAGAVLAPTVSVYPAMGQQFLILSFLVVIFTGVDRVRRNLFVVVVGALAIGVLSNVLGLHMRGVVAQIVLLMAVVAIVSVRPQGLLKS